MILKIMTSLVLCGASFNVLSALLDFQTCVQQENRSRIGQARPASELIIVTCKEKVTKAQKLENDFGSLIAWKWIDTEEIREADESFSQLRVTNKTTDRTLKYIRLQGLETKADTKTVRTKETGEYYFFKVNVRPGATATLVFPEKYLKFQHFRAFSTGTSSSILDRVNTSYKVIPVSIDPLEGIDFE